MSKCSSPSEVSSEFVCLLFVYVCLSLVTVAIMFVTTNHESVQRSSIIYLIVICSSVLFYFYHWKTKSNKSNQIHQSGQSGSGQRSTVGPYYKPQSSSNWFLRRAWISSSTMASVATLWVSESSPCHWLLFNFGTKTAGVCCRETGWVVAVRWWPSPFLDGEPNSLRDESRQDWVKRTMLCSIQYTVYIHVTVPGVHYQYHCHWL